MNHIARLIAGFTKTYLDKGRQAGSETRLLIPGLTDQIAEQLHNELTQQGLPSYLVIRTGGKQVPNAEARKIFADGLTSFREGEMLIVAQPGQISHIQDSIIGSGGTIRGQSFSDEWPWVEATNENYAFPSLDIFVHELITLWGLQEGIAKEWLYEFIVDTLIPRSVGESNRAKLLLESLLGEFASPDRGDDQILRSFLQHCGIPMLRQEWTPYDDRVKAYTKDLWSVGNKVEGVVENAAARAMVLGRAEKMDEGNGVLTEAANVIFDSFGLDTHLSNPLFLFRSCFECVPSTWDVLDLDTISRLFTGSQIKDPEDFEVQVSLALNQSGCIRDSGKNAKTVYVPYGSKLDVKVIANRVLDNHSSVVISKRGQAIEAVTFDNSKETSLVFDTCSITDSAREILLRIEFHEQNDSSGIEIYRLRVNLAGKSRPFFVLLSDHDKPISALKGNEDEEEYPSVYVTRPQGAEVICREDFSPLEGRINNNRIKLTQVGDHGSHFKVCDVIDPAAIHRLTSLIKVAGGGYTAAAFIGMEEVERGYFTIEDELRETLQQVATHSSKRRLREIVRYFKKDTEPYPYLGNIETATQRRVYLCRRWIENQVDGGYPVVLNLNRLKSSSGKLVRNRYLIGIEGDDKMAELESQSLAPESEKALSNYLLKRRKLFNTIKVEHLDTRHPVYASRPVFFYDSDEIKLSLAEYLDAYSECVELLLKASTLSNLYSDRFLLSWLDCVVHLDQGTSVTFVLLGPWHPLVLAQRYMVQKALHDAASRLLSNKLHEGYCRLASLFGAIVGCRWIPFADPELVASVTDPFYVSATSDPGWLVASTSLPTENDDTAYIGLLDQVLGLTVSDTTGQGNGSIDRYLKAFLSAFPSRRSLSIRVDNGYSFSDTIKSAQRLLDNRRDLLPGGIHFIFKDTPPDRSNLEWQDPPILAYCQKKDLSESVENPIDIYLLRGNRLGIFDEPDKPQVCPRGSDLHSVFTEPLMEFSSSSSSLHESGVDNEVGELEPDPLGESYLNLLRHLSQVQKKKRVVTVHSNLREAQGVWSWAVIPARHVDPAVLVALVRNQSPDRNAVWTLWDYRIGIGDQGVGYFTLSRVHHDIKSILEGSEFLVKEDTADNILMELGGAGIALAGEVVRSSATAQGALGLVGALRLVGGSANNEGLLKNDDACLVAFVIPVDSFEEIFHYLDVPDKSRYQRTDLLAVQIRLNPKKGDLEFSFLGIEAKYTKSTLAKARAHSAIEQAYRTVTQVTGLAEDGRKHILERLAFLKLISYGLRLSAPERSASGLDMDAKILKAIIRGKYMVRDLKYNTMVVSSELEYNTASIEMSPAIWVRLSKGHWPNPYTNPSPELTAVQEKLVKFRNTYMFGMDESEETLERVDSVNKTLSRNTRVGESTSESASDMCVPDGAETNLDGSKNKRHLQPNIASKKEGVKLVAGYKSDWPNRDEPAFFHPSNTALNQLNVGIVGDLGTGKTQKIKSLIRDISDCSSENREQPVKILIFDYKGDYTSDEFANATNAQVIAPQNIPLNVLDVQNAAGINPELDRANFLTDILGKIYAGVGHKQGYLLKQAIRNCYELAHGLGVSPTIYDVHDAYKDSINNPDSVLSILDNVTSYEIFERNLEKIKRFEDFFSGITVVDLKALGTWDKGKTMLVVIFLNMFYDYMLHVDKKPFIGDSPQLRSLDSILLVDEADQIMRLQFPILRRILLQGREFGIGVILASQYLSHFKQDREDYREPLLTWFIHKVPNISVKELTEIGVTDVTDETINKIKSLDKHHSFYKTSIGYPCFIRNTTFFEQDRPK